MITGNNLPKSIILVINNEGSIFTLFDYQFNVPVGYLAIGERQDILYTSYVVAEKGYGPLMMDIAMMQVYPKYLASSLEIKPAAQNLYKFYDSQRSDVEKIPLPPDEIEYRKTYSLTYNLPELRQDFLLKNYRKSPEPWVKELLDHSQEIMNKYDYLTIEDIISKGRKYFGAKYK